VTTDEIDRILGSEAPLEPSSGFATAVLERVRLEAAEPPALPFPWGRFALGLAACGVAAAAATVLIVGNASTLVAIFSPLASVAPEIGWAAMSLLIALVATRLPRLVRL
jgi:hypothetical protein